MTYNRKTLYKLIPIIVLVLVLIALFVYKKLDTLKKEEVVVRVGDIYQKVAIPSGTIMQPNTIERGDFSGFSGLPEKNDKEFYRNYDLIYSEDKDKVIVASFIGQGENTEKQKEFVCNIKEKKCVQEKFLFNTYKIGNLDIMSHSVWWLGWNFKNRTVMGLTANGVNNGTLYVCDVDKKTCKGNPKDKLNFPQGAINKVLTKVVAIRQNDIINEKTGDKWELLLYNINDLSKPIKSYDISSAIDRDEDIFYDGVNSIAWSKNDKTILIGTVRNVFKFNLNNGKIDKIFTDVSDGEDDFYWNSDRIKFSPSERYAIFIDTVSEDAPVINDTDDDSEIEEGVLKAIDLKDNNKVIELFQAKDLVLK